MSRLLLDIETNGFLEQLTQVHCIVTYDLDTHTRTSYYGDSLKDCIEILNEADEIIGHNIIAFDIPALQKVYKNFKTQAKLIDTLVISRLIYSNLADLDSRAIDRQVKRKKKPFSKRMIGSHGLEAWGHRLGFHKGDYAKECKAKGIDPWAEFNSDMLSYCENDVDLNVHLYKKLLSKNYSQKAIDLEHEVFTICLKQTEFGACFDVDAAVNLYATLCEKRAEVERQLIDTFGCWIAKDKEFTPKRDNKKQGYKAGCTFTKIKVIEFNPNSRQHIANRLIKKYKWKPTVYTPAGSPQVDEKVLSDLKYPEIPMLLDYLLVNKRISQLAEGKSAWLKLEKEGRIHGRVNTMGAISGRCTHSSPNLAQVPAVRAPFGEECRQLFKASDGWTFVGADASGIELRCLAHYMARWDEGAYVHEILNGDIHTANQKAAGLPTRDQAKTFIYGLLYGAGNAKIGEIIGKGSQAGKKLRDKFMASLPAYKNLVTRVQTVAQAKGYLTGLDGRHLIIRSAHAALNQLLQGAGAVIMKQSLVNFHKVMQSKGYEHGVEYKQVLFVHDELQVECQPEIAEIVGESLVEGMRMTTEDFNLKCPVDGEYKIGKNWAETH